MKVKIEKIAAGGWGLARSESGVVFARAALPGETIEIESSGSSHRTLTRSKGILWTDDYKILESSEKRRESDCPYFPICGGCDFRHIDYEYEREIKLQIVKEVFFRIERQLLNNDAVCQSDFQLPNSQTPQHQNSQTLKLPNSTTSQLSNSTTPQHPNSQTQFIGIEWQTDSSIPVLEYRNTIRIQGGAGYLGYCRKNSNEIVDISDCLIAEKKIRSSLSEYRNLALKEEIKSITFRSGFDESIQSKRLSVTAASRGKTLLQGTTLWIPVKNINFRVSPQSFFQVNIYTAEKIIEHLQNKINGSRLFDLFAGVGLFSILLSGNFKEVIGMEISRSAVEDFRVNAQNKKIQIHRWDASKGIKVKILSDDVVLLDPPRTGLPDKLIRNLIDFFPRTIIYISCDAATFARDIVKFIQAGYLFQDSIKLFDMFPGTSHIELCAILTPAKSLSL